MEEKNYSIEELHEIIGIEPHLIIEFVTYGVVRPIDIQEKSWHFSAMQMHKLQRALRLQHDLELNTPGVALALDLLDELDSLRSQLTELEQELSLFHIDYRG